MKSFNSQSNMN